MISVRILNVLLLLSCFGISAELTNTLKQKIETSREENLCIWLFFDKTSSAENLSPITEFGFRQRHISRYFNAVSGNISADSIFHFLEDNRIDSIDIVYRFRGTGFVFSNQSLTPKINTNYGTSFTQLQRMGVQQIHSAGFRGEGIKIAVFDTGFNPNHKAFQNTNIIAERDFVQNDGNTQNEDGDTVEQDLHGTSIMGILASNLPGVLIGIVPKAEYIIAKTEKVDEEIRVEEDNWIAAVEWADSLGANIISSSLAYLAFDDGFSYDYSDLNGAKTRITIAANIAGTRGINVVTAAGNKGPNSRSIWAPADALSPALTVGAVDESGVIADFSSRGPTADGRIKPDLVAQGVETATVLGINETTTISGTSAATPLIAGAVALARQIHPEWTAQDIWEQLTSSADHTNSPDTTYGYGQINLLKLILSEQTQNTQNITVFPNPATNTIYFYIVEPQFDLYEIINILGQQVYKFPKINLNNTHHFFSWEGKNSAGEPIAPGLYFLHAQRGLKQVKFIFLPKK